MILIFQAASDAHLASADWQSAFTTPSSSDLSWSCSVCPCSSFCLFAVILCVFFFHSACFLWPGSALWVPFSCYYHNTSIANHLCFVICEIVISAVTLMLIFCCLFCLVFMSLLEFKGNYNVGRTDSGSADCSGSADSRI